MPPGALFEQQRYVVLRSFLTDPLLSSVYRYGVKRAELIGPTEWQKMNPDPEAPPTPESYCDPMMDMLLANLTPRIEQASGLALHPAFSYYRVYHRGDRLKKHKDRYACELAVTLNAGPAEAAAWPLQIEGPGGIASITLAPGDAVLYRGLECPHWRDALEGELAVQVFLFYVDRNGPHAEWKFDKREKLASFLR